MSIITYEIDSTPEGIRKRLERKNSKWKLAQVLQQIRSISYSDTMNDAEKLKQIKEHIHNIL